MKNDEFYNLSITRVDKTKHEKSLIFHIPSPKLLDTLIENSLGIEVDTKKINPQVSIDQSLIRQAPAQTIIEEKTVIPFLNLKMANNPDFYKVSKAFLEDIDKGCKHLAFHRLSSNTKESFISIFASFVSYSRNNAPVLVVVEDFESIDWKKISTNFSIGMLQQCKCYDWGNVTILERKQILKLSNSEHRKFFETLEKQFNVVFWSIGEKGVLNEYANFAYFILDSLQSVTLVADKKSSYISKVMENHKFYNEHRISIKGLLNGEER